MIALKSSMVFVIQLAKQVAQMDFIRKTILQKAFDLIDTNGQGYLNKEQCISLLDELNKYRSLPKTSREDFELIFTELDQSGDFKVTPEEFADLCNTIAIKFQKEPPVCLLLQMLIILCLFCVMKFLLNFGLGLIRS
jgi:two pore calcium channel protein